MHRRTVIKWAGLSALAACRKEGAGQTNAETLGQQPLESRGRMPTVFLAHGAPPLLDDAQWVGELRAWGVALPRPSAVLVISAHWATRPACIGATTPVPLVYDFSGFPERFYRLRYPAPPAPAVAASVRRLFAQANQPVADLESRGLDHGAFVPLMCLYSDATVPVLQVSLPGLEPTEAFELGRRLAPLREQGVLLMGSGFLTHNLREGFGPTPAWAKEFDEWVTHALTQTDIDALVDFRARAPAAALAHPTIEHFLPLLVALGAAAESRPRVVIDGFWNDSSFTRKSLQFG